MIQSIHAAGEQKKSYLTGSPQAKNFNYEIEATVPSFGETDFRLLISSAIFEVERIKALCKRDGTCHESSAINSITDEIKRKLSLIQPFDKPQYFLAGRGANHIWIAYKEERIFSITWKTV